MPHEVIEPVVEKALEEARAQGITGKAVTPFLLERVNSLTKGDSMRSNVELVLNNARLAARIAVAYRTLE
jgi:pseudouridine-5'-phosphate glycosidase